MARLLMDDVEWAFFELFVEATRNHLCLAFCAPVLVARIQRYSHRVAPRSVPEHKIPALNRFHLNRIRTNIRAEPAYLR